MLTFTLVAGKKTVGTAKLTLAGGASRTVTVKLNATGKQAAQASEAAGVQLTATTTVAGQRTVAAQ